MADEFGVFRPDTAREILLAFRSLKASGLLAPGVIQDLISGRPIFTETPKLVKNVSGDTIPPYACMQIVGTEEIHGQNYLQVDKPADVDGESGAYIFNWHQEIPVDEKGTAQKHRIVRAFKETGTVTAGDKWKPVVGEWYIEQVDDGQFTACGEDDIKPNVLKIAIDGGGGSGMAIEYTIDSTHVAESGADLPYYGLTVALVTIVGASCGHDELIGQQVTVVDHSGCIFDQDVDGFYGWADWKVFLSLDPDAATGELTPCHWSAINRCCE